MIIKKNRRNVSRHPELVSGPSKTHEIVTQKVLKQVQDDHDFKD